LAFDSTGQRGGSYPVGNRRMAQSFPLSRWPTYRALPCRDPVRDVAQMKIKDHQSS
jgi:hypothetical protein